MLGTAAQSVGTPRLAQHTGKYVAFTREGLEGLGCSALVAPRKACIPAIRVPCVP